MAQRVCIAMALVCSPKVLIADNPTSGLDVTVQAQILDLLAGLAAESGLSTLVATSDLGIVAQYCDEVAVLYSGQVVEYGDVQQFFRDARHPYSLSLIGAASYRSTARLGAGESQSDSSGDISDACQYRLRCPAASMRCAVESPLLTPVHDSQKVRCHHSRETRGLIDGTAD
jgi:oligopeptide/dipeptide ABC transporter ATP-binding protein